jgi:hypothetical protein
MRDEFLKLTQGYMKSRRWQMKKALIAAMFGCVLLYGAATATAGSGFTVERFVVAEGVSDREPVGVAEAFPAGQEEVYCFLEAGDIADKTTVSFLWYHEGTEVASVELPLGAGARWRTWSSKNIAGRTGQWSVELRDASGATVKSLTFKVE